MNCRSYSSAICRHLTNSSEYPYQLWPPYKDYARKEARFRMVIDFLLREKRMLVWLTAPSPKERLIGLPGERTTENHPAPRSRAHIELATCRPGKDTHSEQPLAFSSPNVLIKNPFNLSDGNCIG
jgi:hypothetical protein